MRFTIPLILIFAAGGLAQSGRVKPSESPTPQSKTTVKYVPTQPEVVRAAASPTPTPESSEEIIRIDSSVVPIPVSVFDAGQRAVTTLKAEDFELRINGKVVEIGDISLSGSQVRLAMLFDNSSSVLIAREFEIKAAVRFFEQMIRPDKDLAALYSVATVTRIEQQFTNEVPLLTRSIRSFPQPVGATALLDGLIQASTYLGEVQGRRIIVIVSDGDDTSSNSSLEQAVRALQTANCQVFVVKTTDFENFKRTGSRTGNANIRQLTAERRMIEIAAQTGGKVYSPVDEKELENAFRQISAELSQQYILSYYPESGSENPGDLREITVSVRNRNDLDVRTRKGYYVPKR